MKSTHHSNRLHLKLILLKLILKIWKSETIFFVSKLFCALWHSGRVRHWYDYDYDHHGYDYDYDHHRYDYDYDQQGYDYDYDHHYSTLLSSEQLWRIFKSLTVEGNSFKKHNYSNCCYENSGRWWLIVLFV